MQDLNTNILILGVSNVGKTHFGGQLYGHLQSQSAAFRACGTPAELTLFQDVLEALEGGRAGKRTAVKLHETIQFAIKAPNGQVIELLYPDYGGEQLQTITQTKKISKEISKKWTEQIWKSDHWFLFIRLDLKEAIVDVTTHFDKYIQTESNDSNIQPIHELPLHSAVFYIELLQIFLFVKQLKPSARQKQPKLTILLSCWDKLGAILVTPAQLLETEMPLLFHFLETNWAKENLKVMGLSALGKDLNPDTEDEDYLEMGPEAQAYIITETGAKVPDLTILFNNLIQ